VILDLAMPGCDGFAVLRGLQSADGPLRPVIFLTANGSIGASVRALKSGAVNFLSKPVDESELFAAIEEALRLDAARRAQDSSHRMARHRLLSLTPRERQVLEHVLAGRLNKQIAAELGTVEKTIKVHRARVMHKMGARSVAELVSVAAEAGLQYKPGVGGRFQLNWTMGQWAPAPARRF
jgi:FixJ family two-component response regulator